MAATKCDNRRVGLGQKAIAKKLKFKHSFNGDRSKNCTNHKSFITHHHIAWMSMWCWGISSYIILFMIFAVFDLAPLTPYLNFSFYIYICSCITRFEYVVILHCIWGKLKLCWLPGLWTILYHIFTASALSFYLTFWHPPLSSETQMCYMIVILSTNMHFLVFLPLYRRACTKNDYFKFQAEMWY